MEDNQNTTNPTEYIAETSIGRREFCGPCSTSDLDHTAASGYDLALSYLITPFAIILSLGTSPGPRPRPLPVACRLSSTVYRLPSKSRRERPSPNQFLRSEIRTVDLPYSATTSLLGQQGNPRRATRVRIQTCHSNTAKICSPRVTTRPPPGPRGPAGVALSSRPHCIDSPSCIFESLMVYKVLLHEGMTTSGLDYDRM